MSDQSDVRKSNERESIKLWDLDSMSDVQRSSVRHCVGECHSKKSFPEDSDACSLKKVVNGIPTVDLKLESGHMVRDESPKVGYSSAAHDKLDQNWVTFPDSNWLNLVCAVCTSQTRTENI